MTKVKRVHYGNFNIPRQPVREAFWDMVDADKNFAFINAKAEMEKFEVRRCIPRVKRFWGHVQRDPCALYW